MQLHTRTGGCQGHAFPALGRAVARLLLPLAVLWHDTLLPYAASSVVTVAADLPVGQPQHCPGNKTSAMQRTAHPLRQLLHTGFCLAGTFQLTHFPQPHALTPVAIAQHARMNEPPKHWCQTNTSTCQCPVKTTPQPTLDEAAILPRSGRAYHHACQQACMGGDGCPSRGSHRLYHKPCRDILVAMGAARCSICRRGQPRQQLTAVGA